MLNACKDILLDTRVVTLLAEDSFRENIVDCIDDDTVAIVLCVTVEFVGVSLEPLINVS